MPHGFASSPKIDEAIKFIEQKKTDKVIIVSFFKASLDLFEGILVHDLGFQVARFDGDLNAKQKEAELKRFRETRSCRFLLMTVQSGGVGLNLTEARRMLVLDLWYNPFVHEQVEDRIYRIGQVNDVEIRYFVTAGTIDEAMREINLSKKQNSRTLLDSIEDDGNNNGNTKPYQEMAGMMGRLLQAIRDNRYELEWQIENDPTGKMNRETTKVPRLYAHQVKHEKSKLSSPSPGSGSAKKKTPKKQNTPNKKSSTPNQYWPDSTNHHASPVRQPLQRSSYY